MTLPAEEVDDMQTILESVTDLSTERCHGECDTAPGTGHYLLDPLTDGMPGCARMAGLKYTDVNKVMIPSTNILREGVRNSFNCRAISWRVNVFQPS